MAAWLIVPALALAQGAESGPADGAGAGPLDLTMSPYGIAALIAFVCAYALVMLEELTHIRKSKPVILAASLIWLIVGVAYTKAGRQQIAVAHIERNLLDYAELMLFLLSAMTYVNALQERRVFDALRARLARSHLSYRQLFWLTGALSFLLSIGLNNLTTAVIMGAVVTAVGFGNSRFVSLACINVVVAANAGGAFCPFGDITTLMVWQAGHVSFLEFFHLFVPAIVNFVVPAAIMHFAVPAAPSEEWTEVVPLKDGAWQVVFLFIATILTAILFNTLLGLPPVVGMMLGLAYLQVFGFYLRRKSMRANNESIALDAYAQTARAEWDTLLFFYGVMLSVGGLAMIGYLTMVSKFLYVDHGATFANVAVGAVSSILDNIPLVFAVLTMNPHMSHGQWLLITLTTGVGGSLLSIGSAAGVALMGVAHGNYTFGSHLKWAWAIALGYAASITTHLVLNAGLF